MAQDQAGRLIRSAAHRLLDSAAVRGGLGIVRRLRRGTPILSYHNVVPDDAESLGDRSLHIAEGEFARQCKWIAARYRVIHVAQLVEDLCAGRSTRGTIAITFDDAYCGALEYGLPVLADHQMPCTIFVVSRASERRESFWWDRKPAQTAAERHQRLVTAQGDGDRIAPLDEGSSEPLPSVYRASDYEGLRGLAGPLVHFGSHTSTHRNLTALSPLELRQELEASRADLGKELRTEIDLIAYPYGSWDERVATAARNGGYRAGLTQDSGLNDGRTDLWGLRRINVPTEISTGALALRLAGLR